MQLPANVVKGFVQQVQADKVKQSNNTEHYGTVKILGGELFVRIDGSSVDTPSKTSVAVRNKDRVKVSITNHVCMITDNMTDQPMGTNTLAQILSGALNDYVITNSAIIDSTFSNGLIKGSVIQDSTITGSKIEDSTIEGGKIKDSTITGSNIDFSTFKNGIISGAAIDTSTFVDGTIDGSKIKDSSITGSQISGSTIEASHIGEATFEHITGKTIDAINATIEKINADEITATGVMADWAAISKITTDKIEAAAGYIDYLESNNIKVEDLEAAYIKTTTLEADYIKIGFANIDRADIESFYAKQGMIENVIMKEATVTGELVAVSFKGDVIEASTIKADRLLLKGEDGLYYGINVNALGETKVSELPEKDQEDLKNGLHGEVIIAHSITAEKITVSDLSAFNATIGGFEIDESSIHSIGKTDYEDDKVGLWLGASGEFDLGNADQYIRFDIVDGLRIQTDNFFLSSGDKLDDIFKVYLRFDGRNLKMGHVSNKTELVLSNRGMAVEENKRLATYVVDNSMYTNDSIVMNTLRFNNFIWSRRDNGNMSLKRIVSTKQTAIPDDIYDAFGAVNPNKLPKLYPGGGLYPSDSLYPGEGRSL